MRSGRTLGSPSGFPSSALLSISASSKRPRDSKYQGFTAAILAGVGFLALRAVPRSPAADAGLLDRSSASRARLPGAAVDLEVLLHAATTPLGVAIVAQRGALACNPHLERGPDRLAQPRDLVSVEGACGAQRVDPRTPEGLVRVDVPDAGRRPLVEERGLDGRSPARERLRQGARREAALERLAAKAPRREVVLELARLQQVPGSEPTHVAIGDVRSVV